MSEHIKRLGEEMKAHLLAAREIADTAEKAGRDYTDDERGQLNELMAKASDVKKRIQQAKGDAEIKKAIGDLGDGIGLNEKTADRRTPSGLIVPNGRKSIGEHYIESAEYQELLASAPGGQFTKQHRVQSRPVGFEKLLQGKGHGQKALVTGASDTSGGAFLPGDDLGLRVGLQPFQRPLTLRDLVTTGNTNTDSIEYVRVTSITNNAAPVAEATSAGPATVSGAALVNAVGGGYKPESGIAVARVTTAVKTIAHWIPVTKRALSDAAQMVTLIDNFLQYGLEEELEDQMIAGDGEGENFEGLATVSGVQTQAWDTDLLTTLRKAKTKVRVTGRAMPNGYVLNPADVEALDLLSDNENRYYFGGPASQGMPGSTLWGVPVIESEAVAAGTAYCGDFTRAILWDRQQATITTSDSHESFFIRNLVAILCELRAAFGVLQPSAFVEVDVAA
jgi:HK97 family phage major capsid protein